MKDDDDGDRATCCVCVCQVLSIAVIVIAAIFLAKKRSKFDVLFIYGTLLSLCFACIICKWQKCYN